MYKTTVIISTEFNAAEFTLDELVHHVNINGAQLLSMTTESDRPPESYPPMSEPND